MDKIKNLLSPGKDQDDARLYGESSTGKPHSGTLTGEGTHLASAHDTAPRGSSDMPGSWDNEEFEATQGRGISSAISSGKPTTTGTTGSTTAPTGTSTIGTGAGLTSTHPSSVPTSSSTSEVSAARSNYASDGTALSGATSTSHATSSSGYGSTTAPGSTTYEHPTHSAGYGNTGPVGTAITTDTAQPATSRTTGLSNAPVGHDYAKGTSSAGPTALGAGAGLAAGNHSSNTLSSSTPEDSSSVASIKSGVVGKGVGSDVHHTGTSASTTSDPYKSAPTTTSSGSHVNPALVGAGVGAGTGAALSSHTGATSHSSTGNYSSAGNYSSSGATSSVPTTGSSLTGQSLPDRTAPPGNGAAVGQTYTAKSYALGDSPSTHHTAPSTSTTATSGTVPTSSSGTYDGTSSYAPRASTDSHGSGTKVSAPFRSDPISTAPLEYPGASTTTSSTSHHTARDAGLGAAAGAGTAGLASRDTHGTGYGSTSTSQGGYGGSTTSTTPGTASTTSHSHPSTQTYSSTSHPASSTTTGTSKQAGYDGSKDASSHHYGRDAALGAGGLAAGGAAASALGSKGPQDGSVVDATQTGPASSTIGPHSSNVANVLDPRVQPNPSLMHEHTTVGPHKSDTLNKLDPRVTADPEKAAEKGKPYAGTGAATAGGAAAGAGFAAGAYEAEKHGHKGTEQTTTSHDGNKHHGLFHGHHGQASGNEKGQHEHAPLFLPSERESKYHDTTHPGHTARDQYYAGSGTAPPYSGTTVDQGHHGSSTAATGAGVAGAAGVAGYEAEKHHGHHGTSSAADDSKEKSSHGHGVGGIFGHSSKKEDHKESHHHHGGITSQPRAQAEPTVDYGQHHAGSGSAAQYGTAGVAGAGAGTAAAYEYGKSQQAPPSVQTSGLASTGGSTGAPTGTSTGASTGASTVPGVQPTSSTAQAQRNLMHSSNPLMYGGYAAAGTVGEQASSQSYGSGVQGTQGTAPRGTTSSQYGTASSQYGTAGQPSSQYTGTSSGTSGATGAYDPSASSSEYQKGHERTGSDGKGHGRTASGDKKEGLLSRIIHKINDSEGSEGKKLHKEYQGK